MHVLMYADRPASYGGIETHMATLGKELLRMGHRVTLVFSRILSPELFDVVKAHGGEVTTADRSEIEGLIMGKDVDLVHAHSFQAAKLALAARRRLGVPAATTLHSPDQRLPNADCRLMSFIAVSREIGELLAGRGVPHVVIENGVDLERFIPASSGPPTQGPGQTPSRGQAPRQDGTPSDAPNRQSRPRSRRRLRVLYLGRVSPAKTQGLLAVEKALAYREDIELRYISNWAPGKKERPLSSVEDELREADLVFSTGRGIREAMACGAPAAVLGAFWDGLVTQENVDDLEWCNFSGRATRQPPSPERIAFTVRELLTRPRLRAELKTFGPQLAARRWDARTMAHKTLEVYRSIALG